MDPASVVGHNVVSDRIAALPDVSKILETKHHGEVLHKDGREEDYFMKVSIGDHGREALQGEFESTLAIYNITPDFCPKPIAWGTFASVPTSHFYIRKFYEFSIGVPEPKFHCATYNGNLPQDNSWSDSWDTFFVNGLRHILRVREERARPNVELDRLLSPLFDRIIPHET
ncbi:hypothetical protein F4805DRAFT_468428 [Annulohypoxylon moriforme]|nr:hypothetical protein F4805DRAFT_468428 [Annulohypoxylon moriforme]